MKKNLLSILIISAFSVNAQITDVAVTATPASITTSQSSTISTTGSQQGVNYYLRNSSNTVIAGPIPGNGNDISFNTGILTATETFNIYSESTNSVGLEFDGSNDYLTASLPTNFPYNTSYTIEAWVKSPLPGNAGFYPIFFAGTAVADDIEIYVQKNTNDLVVSHNRGNGGTLQAATFPDPPNNVWYHLAVVFNGSTIEAFYDGVSQGIQSNVAPLQTSGASITIGDIFSSPWSSAGGNSGAFTGKLDDYRIWSTARTSSEINANMHNALTGSETGLETFYTFNDATGSTATDEVGSNDATLTNMDPATDWIIVESAAIPGGTGIGHALDFDGTNDYLTANSPASFTYNNSYTIEAWIKSPLPGNTAYYPIFTAGTLTGDDISIFVQKSSNLLTVTHNRGNGGTQQARQFSSPPNNSWYHLAVTYDGTNIEVFYDGVSQGSFPISTPLLSSGSSIYIGTIESSAWTYGLAKFSGKMDDYRIWSSTRTSSEINSDKAACLTGSETGLSAYYKFNDASGLTATDEVGNNDATLTNMDPAADWTAVESTVIPCRSSGGPSWSIQMTQTATVTVTPTGIDEQSAATSFSVYPNPTSYQITIDTEDNIETIKIIDVTGKIVETKTSTNTTINVAHLIKGLYFLEIKTDNGLTHSRFIKE
ncbi:T9SS type A sorting domain-containing protein [Vicingaceae bacterium]|nr:T9SS type A sorting domain-containing protein [Vicingaceae bacterium]